jgi:formate dehydrogenase subunit delta
MNNQHIVNMANQIASFFEAYPEQAEAIEGVSGHLKKFWSPKMRVKLKEIAEQGDIDNIHQLVLDAIKLI